MEKKERSITYTGVKRFMALEFPLKNVLVILKSKAVVIFS